MPAYRKSSLQRFSSGYAKRKRNYGMSLRKYKSGLSSMRKRRKTNKLLSGYGWKGKQELKYFKPTAAQSGQYNRLDFTTDLCNDTASSQYCVPILCNAITQGSDVTQREGRQVKMKYLEIEGSINPPTSYVHQVSQNLIHENVRMLVVVDHANNQTTTPPPLNIILDCGASAAAASMQSQNNLDYRKRFTILVDKIQNFGWGSSQGGGGTQAITIKEKVQLNMTVNYGAVSTSGSPPVSNDGTQGTISDNAVWIYLFAREQGVDATAGITNLYRHIVINPRLRFTE